MSATQHTVYHYQQENKVLLLAEGDYELPSKVKRYACFSPYGEDFTITQNGVEHTYSSSYASGKDIESLGTGLITIATTGTLYIMLFNQEPLY